MASIGIIGAGKWGTAIYETLSENNKVYISSRTPRKLENFTTINEVLKCEYIVISIATQITRDWLKENFVFQGQKILIASKGIDSTTNQFLIDIYKEYIPIENLAFLSGPTFASEVIQKKPTALVINSINKKLSKKFASFFPNWIKTYTSKDIIGAEIAGAYKNVIAIAAGLSDGMNLGNNAQMSLISRGLVEMSRFGKRFGSKNKTFLDLSGSGDLFLTASSKLSRNFRVGLGLSEEKSIEEICKELGEVAEGIHTVIAINSISKEEKLYTPIADEIYKMLYENKTPKEVLSTFLK